MRVYICFKNASCYLLGNFSSYKGAYRSPFNFSGFLKTHLAGWKQWHLFSFARSEDRSPLVLLSRLASKDPRARGTVHSMEVTHLPLFLSNTFFFKKETKWKSGAGCSFKAANDGNSNNNDNNDKFLMYSSYINFFLWKHCKYTLLGLPKCGVSHWWLQLASGLSSVIGMKGILTLFRQRLRCSGKGKQDFLTELIYFLNKNLFLLGTLRQNLGFLC